MSDSIDLEHFASLLDRPSPAVLTTYRRDGSAVASPVWFRHHDGGLEVVVADGDVKLRHLAANPSSSLLVFEAAAPFRAIRVDGAPTQRSEDLAAVRSAIARRYLGIDGDRFTVTRGPGQVLRWTLDGARAWDLTAILPD